MLCGLNPGGWALTAASAWSHPGTQRPSCPVNSQLGHWEHNPPRPYPKPCNPERNPDTGMEALVVALLEPVARRARRQALGLMQAM
jgi:hypothetical protein